MRLEQCDGLMVRRAQQQAEMVVWLQQAGGQVCAGIAGNHFRLLICSAAYSAQVLVQRFRDCGVAASLPIKQPLSRITGENRPGAERAFARWVSLPLLADLGGSESQQMQRAIAMALS